MFDASSTQLRELTVLCNWKWVPILWNGVYISGVRSLKFLAPTSPLLSLNILQNIC